KSYLVYMDGTHVPVQEFKNKKEAVVWTNARPQYTWSIEPHLNVEPVQNALMMVRISIQAAVDRCGSGRTEVYLSGKHNYRLDLYPEYKANRKHAEKPVHFGAIHNYLIRKWKACVVEDIEADDEVFFIAARNDISACMSELRRLDRPYKRIMIAGGGNIGLRLTEDIEHRYQVKIIERNSERCDFLANHLDHAIVLNGEASQQDLLIEENIEDTDVFLALTNDDEANIMSSLLAKRLGAKKVMTIINNPAYVDLVQGGEIDIAISPQQATIGSLLTHVRRGDVVKVHSLRRGAAEAIEAVAHGDQASSKVVGRAIETIDLPEGTTIGAIVRNDEVLIAHDDIVIESGDHVILFLIDRREIQKVERLFQVGFSFF
ncbi:MAG: Trk system potassium transporter TrkA, partial [Proteobacteria bacterium]|nr:Trk system potassium transporter TrkA [Pseudomonadota bacterium]